MENYTHTTRFILSCNYSSKIIDPIQSRCAVFKFKPLDKDEVFEIVDKIVKEEGLTLDEKAKDAIYEASHGDVRRVENILQSAATFNKTITEETIFSIASLAKPKEIEEVFKYCVKGDFAAARKELLDVMLNYGLSGLDVVIQLQRQVWNVEGISNHQKLQFVRDCGECEFHLIEGSDEFIQLESLLAKLILALS